MTLAQAKQIIQNKKNNQGPQVSTAVLAQAIRVVANSWANR